MVCAHLDLARCDAEQRVAVDDETHVSVRLDGVGEHEEDEWIGARVRVGEAVVAPLGDVGRCVVTTKNPDTGEHAFPTLDTLAGYRRDGVTEPLPFGIYCDVVEPGTVRVGDSVVPVST